MFFHEALFLRTIQCHNYQLSTWYNTSKELRESCVPSNVIESRRFYPRRRATEKRCRRKIHLHRASTAGSPGCTQPKEKSRVPVTCVFDPIYQCATTCEHWAPDALIGLRQPRSNLQKQSLHSGGSSPRPHLESSSSNTRSVKSSQT